MERNRRLSKVMMNFSFSDLLEEEGEEEEEEEEEVEARRPLLVAANNKDDLLRGLLRENEEKQKDLMNSIAILDGQIRESRNLEVSVPFKIIQFKPYFQLKVSTISTLDLKHGNKSFSSSKIYPKLLSANPQPQNRTDLLFQAGKWNPLDMNQLQGLVEEMLKADEQLSSASELTQAHWMKIKRNFPTRSIAECIQTYHVNIERPGENSVVSFEEKELVKLGDIISKIPSTAVKNWKLIATELGTHRSAVACFKAWKSKIQPSPTKRQSFSDEEDALLKKGIEIYGPASWVATAALLPGRTQAQCMRRYSVVGREDKKTGRWKEEEDEMLERAVEQFGTNAWPKVCQLVVGRGVDQVRARWELNQSMLKYNKGPFTVEERARLAAIVETEGTGKWASIASTHFPDRDRIQLARVWNSIKSIGVDDVNRKKRKDQDESDESDEDQEELDQDREEGEQSAPPKRRRSPAKNAPADVEGLEVRRSARLRK